MPINNFMSIFANAGAASCLFFNVFPGLKGDCYIHGDNCIKCGEIYIEECACSRSEAEQLVKE